MLRLDAAFNFETSKPDENPKWYQVPHSKKAYGFFPSCRRRAEMGKEGRSREVRVEHKRGGLLTRPLLLYLWVTKSIPKSSFWLFFRLFSLFGFGGAGRPGGLFARFLGFGGLFGGLFSAFRPFSAFRAATAFFSPRTGGAFFASDFR